MGIKYYCDNCKKPMKHNEGDRLKLKRGHMLVEVISGWRGTWNGGVLCHACIKEAVRYGSPY